LETSTPLGIGLLYSTFPDILGPVLGPKSFVNRFSAHPRKSVRGRLGPEAESLLVSHPEIREIRIAETK
jgi:hypothetical protein